MALSPISHMVSVQETTSSPTAHARLPFYLAHRTTYICYVCTGFPYNRQRERYGFFATPRRERAIWLETMQYYWCYQTNQGLCIIYLTKRLSSSCSCCFPSFLFAYSKATASEKRTIDLWNEHAHCIGITRVF